MSRLMALDYGTKRTGIAVTDPLQLIATGLDTVPTTMLFDFLTDYVKKETVAAFVVGLPKSLNNSDTESTERVNAFIGRLKAAFPDIPVHPHDERFTSAIAFRSMIESGTRKKDRQNKGNIDKVSAVIILQSYMESSGRPL